MKGILTDKEHLNKTTLKLIQNHQEVIEKGRCFVYKYLSEMLGIGHNSVERHLRKDVRDQIPSRKAKGRKRNFSHEDILDVVIKFPNLKLREIAEMFGCGVALVSNIRMKWRLEQAENRRNESVRR